MPITLNNTSEVISYILKHIEGDIRLATPLGLGKPYHLLNGLYDAVAKDASRHLTIYTALSLNPPIATSDLEKRFLTPFVNRLYGKDFPRLKYADANTQNALPKNIHVEEFYMQSGELLGSHGAQACYASLNYTHVAEALATRDLNLMVQKIASDGAGNYSLSCNTDLTMDTLDAIADAGKPLPFCVGVVDDNLPFIGGSAQIDASRFDVIVNADVNATIALDQPNKDTNSQTPKKDAQLFALPRQPVSDVDYAIGLYASTLVKDGGTLQIGIGALADALCHALVLRHTDNACYRKVINALDPTLADHPTVKEFGGLEPFEQGLYGCSEMLNEGFRVLVQTGLIKRRVIDDELLMARIAQGDASEADYKILAEYGQFLHGAFYLGSPDFYEWLRGLEGSVNTVGMKRISEINDVVGTDYVLQTHKRQHARFFNTCMMATVLGGASSETLPDGRVVSGVGGQYNFVSMGHTLPNAKSVLMLRASRQSTEATSNIKWAVANLTIPRHLRDVYVTEYGIADLRYVPDGLCIRRMLQITDARFQQELLDEAVANKKLSKKDATHASHHLNTASNTLENLKQRLQPFRQDGTLPDYPLGSDFTDTEQDIVRALGWLRIQTKSQTSLMSMLTEMSLTQLGELGDHAQGRAGKWVQKMMDNQVGDVVATAIEHSMSLAGRKKVMPKTWQQNIKDMPKHMLPIRLTDMDELNVLSSEGSNLHSKRSIRQTTEVTSEQQRRFIKAMQRMGYIDEHDTADDVDDFNNLAISVQDLFKKMLKQSLRTPTDMDAIKSEGENEFSKLLFVWALQKTLLIV